MKLDISYDFGLVQHMKRGAGDIYIRIDYSNLLNYWKTVDSPGAKRKRSRVDKRFFSSSPAAWARKFGALNTASTAFSSNLNSPIYGLVLSCSGSKDNYVEIGLSGRYLHPTLSRPTASLKTILTWM